MNSFDTLMLHYGKNRLLVRKDEPFTFYATFIAGEYKMLNVKPGDVVLDAGSNIGDFTVYASKKVGSSGKIIAVEPNPKNLAILNKNIKLNNLNNVIILPYALSNVKKKMYLTEDSSGGTLTTDRVSGISVNTITLDDILTDLKLKRFDIIKMDIEGGEEMVFSSPQFLLKVRELAMELHGKKNIAEIPDILQKNGFIIHNFTLSELSINVLKAIFFHLPSIINAEFMTNFIMMKGMISYLIRKKIPIPSLSDTNFALIYAFKKDFSP